MFNIKSDDYYRSQLVAKEFSQVREINFDELFSLVVYYETVHYFWLLLLLKIGISIVLM